MAIRVLIADDHRPLRDVLRLGLRRFDDIDVVGEADSGGSAAEQARSLRPDVVLMDLRMPGGNGIAATDAIRVMCPKTQVLILTSHGEVELLRGALAAGAAGFVLKDTTLGKLVAVIRAVHQGDTVLNSGIARQLLEGVAPGRSDVGGRRLADRGTECVDAVANGRD